jgi:Flp pilus assembly protein TadG
VIASAHKGMTDALIAAARTAAEGQAPGEAVIDKQRRIAASSAAPTR